MDTADKAARDSQSADRCSIDPTGRFMALELFEGVVTVIPFLQKGKRKGSPEVDVGNLGEPIPARIPELFVRSSAFLYPRDERAKKPRLALLYEDNHQKTRYRIRELDYSPGGSMSDGSAVFEEMESIKGELELGASHIIPVPAPVCEYYRTDYGHHLTLIRWCIDSWRDIHNVS